MFMGFRAKRNVARLRETEIARTKGTILDYVPKVVHTARRGSHTYWIPIVEFRTDGKTYRSQYQSITDREQFPIGAEVDVNYNWRDPTHFHLENDPTITDPGGGAIRMSIIWIIACAIMTILLAILLRHQGF